MGTATPNFYKQIYVFLYISITWICIAGRHNEDQGNSCVIYPINRATHQKHKKKSIDWTNEHKTEAFTIFFILEESRKKKMKIKMVKVTVVFYINFCFFSFFRCDV